MTWRYGIVKRTLDDSPIYGMSELYFTDGLLQAWSENPYWTEQDRDAFYPAIDKLEARFRHEGYIAEWAIGYSAEEYKTALKHMRHDLKLPVVDEEKVMEAWDGDA